MFGAIAKKSSAIPLSCLMMGLKCEGVGISNSSSNNESMSISKAKSEILFLGTGSSLGTPVAMHLMNPDTSDPRTFVSREAAKGDPRDNRNYRCNPCLMIRHRTAAPCTGSGVNDANTIANKATGTDKGTEGSILEKNIVVDVGEKTPLRSMS